MMKDAPLKTVFMRSLWASGAFPTPEVRMYHPEGDQRYEFTDIDVLAHHWHPFGRNSRTVIDCKDGETRGKGGPSPINRSLWLGGLMNVVGAETGICVVPRKAPTDHRVAARSQGVVLLAAEEVETYLSRTSHTGLSSSAACEHATWDSYKKNFPTRGPHEELINYLYGNYWRESSADCIRHILQKVRSCAQSWDSTHRSHLALGAECGALLSLSLHQVAINLFDLYLLPPTKAELAEYLLIHIYGGKNQYEFLTRLQKYIVKSQETEGGKGKTLFEDSTDSTPAVTLPEWDRFVNLTRLSFDNLAHFGPTCQLFRALAFDCFLMKKPPEEIVKLVPHLSGEACTLAVSITDYLGRAGKLPPLIVEEIRYALGKVADVVARPEVAIAKQDK